MKNKRPDNGIIIILLFTVITIIAIATNQKNTTVKKVSNAENEKTRLHTFKGLKQTQGD